MDSMPSNSMWAASGGEGVGYHDTKPGQDFELECITGAWDHTGGGGFSDCGGCNEYGKFRTNSGIRIPSGSGEGVTGGEAEAEGEAHEDGSCCEGDLELIRESTTDTLLAVNFLAIDMDRIKTQITHIVKTTNATAMNIPLAINHIQAQVEANSSNIHEIKSQLAEITTQLATIMSAINNIPLARATSMDTWY